MKGEVKKNWQIRKSSSGRCFLIPLSPTTNHPTYQSLKPKEQVGYLVCYITIQLAASKNLTSNSKKMINCKVAIPILFFLLLTSCYGPESEAEFQRPLFKETPVEKVYAKLRPSTQRFEIDNGRTTKIVAEKKTEILIPKDCFVDNNGNPVEGPVKMEVVEVFDLSDFITAGLTTLSDDKLLISNGMLYLDAKSASGNSLQLKEGAEISVTMPTMKSNEGFQMFTGDGTNWTVDPSMLEEDYLIPLPLELLYPRGNNDFIDYWYFEGVVHSANYFLDTTIVNHSNPKFENTIIATEEFANRHYSLKMMMYYMSLLNQEEYFLDEVVDKNRPWNYDIWKIYYENLDQPLYVLDSLAKQHYSEYFYKNKEKLIVFTKKINSHWKDYHDYRGRENLHDYFDFSKQTIDEWFLSPLTFYPESNRNELKLIKDYGVDLNAADAYAQLMALDIPQTEIDGILQYHFKRKSLIQNLQKQKDRINDEKALSTLYETTAFSLKKLGWINCDRFYKDPEAGKAEILLANSSNNQLNFIDFSLVIPDMNVRLMSYPRKSELYSFTNESGMYTKLPIGKEAIVIGVAVQNDSIFYASQNIKIKDGLRLDLEMEYIVEEALNDSLAFALK